MFTFKNWKLPSESLGIEGTAKIPTTEVQIAIT